MREIKQASKFRRDVKKLERRGYDFTKFKLVVKLLAEGYQLPPEFHDHDLQGQWKPSRECHLAFDIVLVYQIQDNTVYFQRIGTHADVLGC